MTSRRHSTLSSDVVGNIDAMKNHRSLHHQEHDEDDGRDQYHGLDGDLAVVGASPSRDRVNLLCHELGS